MEIGIRLIPLVESKHGKGLAERIGSLRTDMASKHGTWIPSIRIRDNINLSADAYRIMINGREIAKFELREHDLLAINPGTARGTLVGIDSQDPAFHLPAKWIAAGSRQRAEVQGYTVVDGSTVLITHLGEVLRKHAHELLSREDLRKLIDKVKESAPTVVEELRPDVIRMGDLHQTVTLLLEEHVPITNFTRILEVVVQHGHQVKNPTDLVELVRHQISRDILDRFRNENDQVTAMVCDPRLEGRFRECLHEGKLALLPDPLERLIGEISSNWQQATKAGSDVILLTDGAVRRALRQSLSRALPELAVIAYHEVPNDTKLNLSYVIKHDDVFKGESSMTPGAAPQATEAREMLEAI